MQLIYRGTTYDYNTLKASSRPARRTTPYTLSYRGVTYQVNPKSESSAGPVQTLTHQLVYRGNVYYVTRTVPAAKVSTSNQCPELTMQTL